MACPVDRVLGRFAGEVRRGVELAGWEMEAGCVVLGSIGLVVVVVDPIVADNCAVPIGFDVMAVDSIDLAVVAVVDPTEVEMVVDSNVTADCSPAGRQRWDRASQVAGGSHLHLVYYCFVLRRVLELAMKFAASLLRYINLSSRESYREGQSTSSKDWMTERKIAHCQEHCPSH